MEKRRNERTPHWLGDGVGKIGIHVWLRKNFGKPQLCEGIKGIICNRKSKLHEWALRKGFNYERKRENFIRLCVPCHRKYDLSREHRI